MYQKLQISIYVSAKNVVNTFNELECSGYHENFQNIFTKMNSVNSELPGDINMRAQENYFETEICVDACNYYSQRFFMQTDAKNIIPMFCS